MPGRVLLCRHLTTAASYGSKALSFTLQDRAFGNVEAVIDDDAVVGSWGPSQFDACLDRTVRKAVEQNKTAVWLQLRPEACAHIKEAVNAGFILHHAQDGRVAMVKWLREGASKVPSFGTHQIGVAGICINEHSQVLVCKEKNSKFAHWKFPGGLADKGEELGDAAEREVLEETGVRSVFEGLVGIRHSHGMQWGLSDLYIACRLRPISNEISIQESEIETATWMDVDVFRAEAKHPMLKVFLEAALEPTLGLTVSQMKYPKFMSGVNRPPFNVYHHPGLSRMFKKKGLP